MQISSLIRDFGSQEVLKDSKVLNLEFNNKRLFLMKAESGEVGDCGSRVEHVEISEGELLSHWLSHFEHSLVIALLITFIVAKFHGARANLSFN